MDFRLTEAQNQLQERARRLLDEHFSPAHVREAEASSEGFPRELWDRCVERGWSAMPVDEAFGGHGLGLLDTSVVVEELGRASATLPMVVTSGVAATILQRSPQGATRDRLLQSIAAGTIVAPALIDEHGRNEWEAPRLPLVSEGDGFRSSGAKVLVPFGLSADVLLLTATLAGAGTAIVALDPSARGVTITAHRSKVGTPLAMVELADVHVSSDQLIHEGDAARTALLAGLQTGSLLATAEAVGMCAALTAMTAEHVTRREAFGKPIGAFQAVAHPVAEMRINGELIRILVQQAAWLLDNDLPADEEVSAAKALANELFVKVANDAYRLHGARAFSTACDVQLYMRRVQGFIGGFGETQESYERAAAALGM